MSEQDLESTGSAGSPARRLLGAIGYGLVLILALGFGSALGWLNQSEVFRAGIGQVFGGQDPAEVFEEPDGSPSDHLTLLILGCDEDRAPGGAKVLRTEARSDMMLVARLDFKTKRISGVSIPRDTLATVKGYKTTKINAFHSLGGAELAQQAVEGLLDIDIDRTLVLDYEAMEEAVDLLGGVEVDIAKDMQYKDVRGGLDIDLKAGTHRLSGKEALDFVRFRHDDSDFERQQRQKDFLLSVRRELASNPLRLAAIADKLVEIAGGALTAPEIASLAFFVKGIDPGDIVMKQLPVTDGSGSNLRIDEKASKTLLTELGFFGLQEGAAVARR